MSPSKISQWLLKHDAPFTEEDRNALALLSKTYPYFVPSKYVEAATYNAERPFAPAILNKMRLYMGDWISFHQFLQENGSQTNSVRHTSIDTEIEDYNDDQPEYFFDTFEDEQEILKTVEQQVPDDAYEDDENDDFDFELFNEKENEEQPFASFDTRKEKPKVPEMKVEENNSKKEIEKQQKIEQERLRNEEEEKQKNDAAERLRILEEEKAEKERLRILEEQKQKAELEHLRLEKEKLKAEKEREQLRILEEEKQRVEVERLKILEEQKAEKERLRILEEEKIRVEAEQLRILEEQKEKEKQTEEEALKEKTTTKLKSEPLIQPIYTEDYFLHQGIESVETEEENDEEKQLMVMMSFSDWLMHFKTKNEKQKEEEEDQRALKTMWQKEKLAAALEEENEEIPEKVFEMAVNSIRSEEDLVSESLAEIMIKQGKIDKAIEMYRKLSLRNPQKNTYFADKIEKLIKEK